MFAIVKVKDRQFKVWTGDFLRAPFMGGDPPAAAKPEAAAAEETLISLPILALQDASGCLISEDQLKGASAKVRVAGHGLAKKELVLKKKRRKGYRRTKGHRQKFTELQVVEISAPSGTHSLKKALKKKPKKESGGQAEKQPEGAVASMPGSSPSLEPAPAQSLSSSKSESGGRQSQPSAKPGEGAVKSGETAPAASPQPEENKQKAGEKK